jgi:hypothetical protein
MMLFAQKKILGNKKAPAEAGALNPGPVASKQRGREQSSHNRLEVGVKGLR